MADLAGGRLGPMFSGPTLRNHYPSCPPPKALIDLYAMFLVGGLVTATVYVLRVKLKKPLGVVSIALLALGAVPYAQGAYVLQASGAQVHECGPWLAVMLLGVLYASVSAAVMATMELTGWHDRLLAWLNGCLSRTTFHGKAELRPGLGLKQSVG